MGDSIGNAGVVGETNYANLIARIQKLESTQKKLETKLEEKDVWTKSRVEVNADAIAELSTKYDTFKTILAGIISKVDSFPAHEKFVKIEENGKTAAKKCKQLEGQVKEIMENVDKQSKEQGQIRKNSIRVQGSFAEKISDVDKRLKTTAQHLQSLTSDWYIWKENNVFHKHSFNLTPAEQLVVNAPKDANCVADKNIKAKSDKEKEFPELTKDLGTRLTLSPKRRLSSKKSDQSNSFSFDTVADWLDANTSQRSRTKSTSSISIGKLNPSAPEFNLSKQDKESKIQATADEKSERYQHDQYHDNKADKAEEDTINASKSKSSLIPDAKPFVFNGSASNKDKTDSRNSEVKESDEKPTGDQFNKKAIAKNDSDTNIKLKVDAMPFTMNVKSTTKMLVNTNVLQKAFEDWTTKNPPTSVTHTSKAMNNLVPNATLQTTAPRGNSYQQATHGNINQLAPTYPANLPRQSIPHSDNITPPPSDNLAMPYLMYGNMVHGLQPNTQFVSMPGVQTGYALPTIVRQPANY